MSEIEKISFEYFIKSYPFKRIVYVLWQNNKTLGGDNYQTWAETKDQKIRQRVWKYCSDLNIFYSARLHVDIWGQGKGK